MPLACQTRRRRDVRPSRDPVLLCLAAAHAGVLLTWPSLLVVAFGSWWHANTIAHLHIHRPMFTARLPAAIYSACSSLVLGVPQELWRRRHLAHHARRALHLPGAERLAIDCACLVALWVALGVLAPEFLWTSYAPGLAVGQALCALHGHQEHRGGGATSHHGRFYNWLFLNDGYHAEHHAEPMRHWRDLPECALPPGGRTSRWPPVLRWLEGPGLDALERFALWSAPLRAWLIDRHERAFRALLPDLTGVRRVAIVGGGLFPRSAFVIRRCIPGAGIVLIDAVPRHLDIASRWLGGDVECVQGWFDPRLHVGFDLLVIPLAYRGDRTALYRNPPGARVVVHDWLWRRRGRSTVVSWLLMKRVNLVRGALPLRADARESA